MRFIFSLFQSFFRLLSRKPSSTEEQLTNVTNSLKVYEDQKKDNLDTEKQIVKGFLLYSFMVYFIATAFILFYIKPSETKYWLIYFAPIIFFPFIIFYVKKIIHWYYVRRIKFVDEKIIELKNKTKELLNKVMECENYMKAKEILKKFDPCHEFRDDLKDLPEKNELTRNLSSSATNIAQQSPKSTLKTRKAGSVCDLRPPQSIKRKQKQQILQENGTGKTLETEEKEILPPPKLPRPILNQNRSNFDKFIDYIVGDGFDKRYALICQSCYSHNGMALIDEFEYLTFQCVYCLHLNPARKTKPEVPASGDNTLSVAALTSPLASSSISQTCTPETDLDIQQQIRHRGQLHNQQIEQSENDNTQ